MLMCFLVGDKLLVLGFNFHFLLPWNLKSKLAGLSFLVQVFDWRYLSASCLNLCLPSWCIYLFPSVLDERFHAMLLQRPFCSCGQRSESIFGSICLNRLHGRTREFRSPVKVGDRRIMLEASSNRPNYHCQSSAGDGNNSWTAALR